MDGIRLGHRTAQTICIKFWSSVEMQIPAVATLCALMWLFTRQGAVHLPGARDQVTEGDSLNVRCRAAMSSPSSYANGWTTPSASEETLAIEA